MHRLNTGMSYLDITDQLTAPETSPATGFTGYVQNGVVVLSIPINKALVTSNGTYVMNITEEYAPISTVAGTIAVWGNQADCGKASIYVMYDGQIVLVFKEALLGNITFNAIYPLKKPMVNYRNT